MSERKITQLFGLILGALFTCTLVLHAFAYLPPTRAPGLDDQPHLTVPALRNSRASRTPASRAF